MSRKKWTVSQYDKDMAAELAESYELDPFAALLLVSRGVTADNADEFLYPQCDIDPFPSRYGKGGKQNKKSDRVI